MEKQLTGTQAELQKTPSNMEHDAATKKPLVQLTGTQAPLSHTPSPVSHNGNITEGVRNLTGTAAPLNTAPQKAYASLDHLMSHRVKETK